MALGRPVITHSVPWHDQAQLELVQHGECGIVANSVRTMKNAILQLAADKEAETKAVFDAIRLITQLRDENERLRKQLDYVLDDWGCFKNGHSGGHGIDSVFQEWLAAKGVQP
jgi:hypothetical protein